MRPWCAFLAVWALVAASAAAEGRVAQEDLPGPLRDVELEQLLGAQLPLDGIFLGAEGQPVRLAELFGERPVVLAFVYYECPMLCGLILDGLAKSLAVLPLEPGRDFDILAISIDPGETPELASGVRQRTLRRYGRGEDPRGWHFLTGKAPDIAALTQAAGFRYVYDEKTDEYAHASGIMIVTPEGQIAQYHYGFEYAPKDLKLALVEAAGGKIGSLIDQVLLFCYRYDPKLGKYTAMTMRILRLVGVLFALGLTLFLWLMLRRDQRTNREGKPTLGTA